MTLGELDKVKRAVPILTVERGTRRFGGALAWEAGTA